MAPDPATPPTTTTRPTHPPPSPKSFKPTPLEDRISKHPTSSKPTSPPKGIFPRLWPFRTSPSSSSYSSSPSQPIYLGEQNFSRGLEASRRVVREGVLDPRYKAAATRVTALICAMPIVIYLSWELYQRRFLGKGRRVRPVFAEKGVEEKGDLHS